jgi:hypothetical protein
MRTSEVMRERKRIAVVLPVGPKDAEAAFDTLASVLYYLSESLVVVAVDDTGAHTDFARHAAKMSPDIVVRSAPPHAPGADGGLWVKLAAGYQWLLDRYEPEMILRLDADALIIGAGIEELAAREFAKDRKTGLLGAYRVSPDGTLRDWSWAARRFRVETGIRGLRHPAGRARLRDFIAQARQNAYVDGEHALGGSYIHSFDAAHAIHAKGWFRDTAFATSKLGEDHLMGLVTVAAGYRIADFGRPEDPMALEWRHLPDHPDKLLANGKLVTHSVRAWEYLGEPEIRGIFRAART